MAAGGLREMSLSIRHLGLRERPSLKWASRRPRFRVWLRGGVPGGLAGRGLFRRPLLAERTPAGSMLLRLHEVRATEC